MVDFGASTSPTDVVSAMVETLGHRGPDNSSTKGMGPAAFGHTRLSIIDIGPDANQPFTDATGRFYLTYNGEIYNFRELRDELSNLGIRFTTSSDTEVVFAALTTWGADALSKFNGMFALGLWDAQKQELLLARDRFGIKPLYFSCSDASGLKSIGFGSEIKALLAIPDTKRDVSWQALHEYLYYGNPLGTNSFYKGIRSIPPGGWLRFSKRGIENGRYFDVAKMASDPRGAESPASSFQSERTRCASRVQELLRNSVHRHLVSDVPLGVLLSGGIDSSAITAFAAEAVSDLRTYSIGFDFQREPGELTRARQMASLVGADHREIPVSASDLPSLIEKLVRAHDEPFADAANLPLLLATEALRGEVKVLLQGDGGDEVFGGYRRYGILSNPMRWRMLAKAYLALPSALQLFPLAKRLGRFAEAFTQPTRAERAALLLTVESKRRSPLRLFGQSAQERLSQYDPFQKYREVSGELEQADDVQHMLLTDMQVILPNTFLPKVDRATMANSMEVRVPFLDTELTDFVLSLPSNIKVSKGEKKALLKLALRGVVPDFILDAPKTGFGVPVSEWLRTSLFNYTREIILDGDLAKNDLIDKDSVSACLQEHKEGRADNGFMLYKLLQLGVWGQMYQPSY